jgi:hypothetical protein
VIDVISRRSNSSFKKLSRSLFRRPATELARALIDFASIRDTEALAKLPAEVGAAWQKLWTDVDALLRKVAGSRNGCPRRGPSSSQERGVEPKHPVCFNKSLDVLVTIRFHDLSLILREKRYGSAMLDSPELHQRQCRHKSAGQRLPSTPRRSPRARRWLAYASITCSPPGPSWQSLRFHPCALAHPLPAEPRGTAFPADGHTQCGAGLPLRSTPPAPWHGRA